MESKERNVWNGMEGKGKGKRENGMGKSKNKTQSIIKLMEMTIIK